MNRERKLFRIKIEYFKDSGKFYTSEDFSGYFECCENGCCYMADVCDWLRKNQELPGLQSGSWNGYIYVDCEDGYPCLIVPERLRVSNEAT